MSHPQGDRTPKMRGGRERLTVHRPQTEHALASITFDGFNIDETRRFGNRLLAQVEAFQRCRPTPDEGNRLSKVDAHHAYNRAFGIPRPKKMDHQAKATRLARSGVGWPREELWFLVAISSAETITPKEEAKLAHLEAIASAWKAQRKGERQ